MEACVRGFSYMPESKIDVKDLKYVESEALERTWKTTRRERIKQQEQKVWDEFVKEEDIVRNISQDDPYLFIDQLPEGCIEELLEMELKKMKQDHIEEVQEDLDQPESPVVENQHVVTFAEDVEKECNMLNIFDDDKDDYVSGPDEELLNDSLGSPCTVRERLIEETHPSPKHHSPDKTSSKSSGVNMTDMIQNSIHSAKVKELRSKINEELNNIIGFLERKNIINIDPNDIPKMMKCSVEFTARFSRVHAYQLQRQLSELQRQTRAGPAQAQARHTHARAQAARVSSLHNNLLAALQVYCKSLNQTACIRESGDLLRSLVQFVGEASSVSAMAWNNANSDLYTDGIQLTCDKLNATLVDYTQRILDYMSSTANTSLSCSRRSSKISGKKKPSSTWSKSGTKSLATTDARLSMYSLDIMRCLQPKSTSSKDNSSGTSKMHGNLSVKNILPEKEETSAKSQKKSSRRPLMRAPPRPRRAPPELDVHTLVEAVQCTSNHISREQSPVSTPKSKNVTPRKHKETPRTPKQNRKSLNNSPRFGNIKNSPKTESSNPINSPRKEKENLLNSPRKEKENSVISPRKEKVSPVNSPRIEKANSLNTNKVVQESIDSSRKFDTNNLSLGKKGTEDNMSSLKERDDIKATLREVITEKDINEEMKYEKEKIKMPDLGPASCEVTKLLRQLCGGDAVGSRNERVTGAKNAQLLCVTGTSPRQPSTPQLLRILEETIQKKTPRALFPKPNISAKDAERYRMPFNIPEHVTENLFQYRTKFVQHMLTSTMYANSAIGKPWEKIESVSDQIIDELLKNCAKDMELQQYVNSLYKSETC